MEEWRIEKLIEIHVLKRQVERKIDRFLGQENCSHEVLEQKKLLNRIKDLSTSGDAYSRKTLKEYIKAILLEGVELYGLELDGRLSERVEQPRFFISEGCRELDMILPFECPEKLSTDDKFGILLSCMARSQKDERFAVEELLKAEGMISGSAIFKENVDAVYGRMAPVLDMLQKLEYIVQKIYQELYGLMELDRLAYSSINEVGFAGDGGYVYLWAERKIHLAFLKYTEREARIIQERAISFDRHVGALNENNPEVLCHRFDGARVTVTQKPYFSARNCCIRVFNKNDVSFEELHSDERLKLLSKALVKTGQSMVFQGGLGTGKSTFMSMLYEFLDRDLHVGLLEDMFEMHILEKYGAERRVIEAQRTINKTLQNGVETFLRMSVDVAGLGEARNGEALFSFIQLVQSVSVSAWMTAQVNCPENTVHRMKNMLMATGIYSEETAAAHDIVHNINFIVQNHSRGGDRFISEICEIVPDTALAIYGNNGNGERSTEELERGYYIHQLQRDVVNTYTLNRIYDNRSGKGVFVNYPSQKFLDRASRFPASEAILKELFEAILMDTGMDHRLRVWWQ